MGGNEDMWLIEAARTVGWEKETLDKAMVTWDVKSPQELYAKFVATGRDVALFASAVGMSPERFKQLIDELQRTMPEKVVEELEVEVPVMPFGAKKPIEDADETDS